MSYQKVAEKKIRQRQKVKEREEKRKDNVWFHGHIAESAAEYQVFTKHALQIYHAIDKYDGFIEEIGRTFTLGLGKNNKDKPYTPRKVVDLQLSTFKWNVDQAFAIFGMPERAMDLKERGIKDVTILVIEDTPNCLAKMIAKALGYKYSTIKEIGMKKFDAVIANPPYAGKAALHQQFFNMAVDVVVDDGTVCFIQPATPYHNKKVDKKGPEDVMIDNIKKFTTSVIFTDFSIFSDEIRGQTQLAITTLIKKVGNGRIVSVTHRNNKIEHDVLIDDLNEVGLSAAVFIALRDKYLAAVEKFGSLHCIASKSLPNNDETIWLPWGTGEFGYDRYYSIVTKNMDEFWKKIAHRDIYWGVNVPKAKYEYFESFAKSFVARFGLVFLKFNQHNENGEFKAIPLVPFDRMWTDEQLAELIGLTDDELQLIRNTLHDYHGLLERTEYETI